MGNKGIKVGSMKEDIDKKDRANGEICHTLDEKDRLAIPSRFRKILSDSFVLTRGLDHCLWLMTTERWKRLEAGIKKMNHNLLSVRNYERSFQGGMCEVELDKQGRFVLKSTLKEYAGIDKEVLFSQGTRYIEIWAKDKYFEMLSDIDMADCAEQISLIWPDEEDDDM